MPGGYSIHCQIVIDGICHLGSGKAVPDQAIQRILITVQVTFQHIR